MSDKERSEAEDALVDAELFLKYRMVERAIAALRDAVTQSPANTKLRWRLAEVYLEEQFPKDAAQEFVTLANIYVRENQYNFARSALMKVKEIYPNAQQIDTWLITLDQYEKKQEASPVKKPRSQSTLVGDLGSISLFDIVQTIEKNKITGIIYVNSSEITGSIYFNHGLIADAVIGKLRGKAAFRQFAEVTDGSFELVKSPVEFQSSIITASNAQLILEIFAEEPEESAEI